MEKLKDILLIDDRPSIYQNFIDELQKLYNVVVALSLRGAQRQLRYRKFDLAIVDMMMPANGFKNINDFHAGLMFYDSVIRSNYPEMPTIIWSVIDEVTEYKDKKQKLGQQIDNLYYCNKERVSNLLSVINSIFGYR